MNKNLKDHKEIELTENITSEKNEGKGGADRVKKNDKTIIKDNSGLKHNNPRIKTFWRVKKIEYSTPTNINNKGELSPCKNITESNPLNPKKLEENNIIGTVIICDTEE